MAVKIYHGDILFTPSADRLEIHENSYIIVEDGVVSQICEKIPEQYQGAEVVDYGDKLIIRLFPIFMYTEHSMYSVELVWTVCFPTG